MQFLSSFAALAPRYDAFLLDLWGVIHDGQNLYPGAKDCLERLRGEGKRVVLLSNAPRRASSAAETLVRLGIHEGLYDALVTSGETAYRSLGDEASGYFRPAGQSYIYIGLERDRRVLDGLGYTETEDPEKANFLLLAHFNYDHQPMSELAPLLGRCIALGIPALCINPDKEVVRLTGEQVACAGIVAAYYAGQGGRVIYFGKPHAVVYERALGIVKPCTKERILAVGDTLATDIQGAARQDLASALITGGVLKGKMGDPASPGYQAACADYFTASGITPDYVLPAFNW